ncbi:MAG TPA: protein kinase [Pseudomonadales bacterium]|nr:protein kinase [Pseudomonadales bacterium]
MAEARLEIPGYSIEREIGRGGMARVYLAVQKKFGRLVAIKVVSPEYTADPSFGKRFVREARIIAQLSHPNIVQVHDAGVNDQCYYLVMEYLRGGDLNRRLKRGLHMQAAISVVKDIARGLDNAHAKGFVHRDIKPENILFREDGSAVLSDFGVARVISSGASITRHGTVVGTPQYMSPEQASGKPLDGRSDIYSLGVVFYRMLTGEVPFKADSAVAVGIRHLQDPVPRLPGHLSAMQNVVDRFLAKKPEARYQTGAEVIDALDGVRAAGMVPNTVIKTEVVNTAEIRAIGDSMSIPVVRDGRTIRAEPDQRPKQTRQRRRAWPWVAFVIVVLAGTWSYLYPWNRDNAIAKVMIATGLTEKPALLNAWRQAESLRGDPNQSLAAVVAGYRRVLDVDSSYSQARTAIADLATQWKTSIGQALAADDLALAEAKLTESLAVFPNDEELTSLFEKLSDRKRADSLVTSTEALLHSHGLDDQPSATAAIQAYQEALRLNPNHAVARSELARLAERYAQLASTAAEAGDITGAMNYLERATTANANSSDVVTVRDKVQQAATSHQEIQTLLQQASAYRANGALINPPGSNAAEIYHRVLATDPNNAIANQGLSEVVAELLTRATELLSTGQIEGVRALSARASEIGLSDTAIRELKAKLGAEEQRIGSVSRLLNEAQKLMTDGFITEPPEQNAVARLLEVRRLDPNNQQARDMLNAAAGRLASVAREAYDAGLKTDAQHFLELALTVTPDVPEWRAQRDSWAAEGARGTKQ